MVGWRAALVLGERGTTGYGIAIGHLMLDYFSTPMKHSMNAPEISAVYCLAVHSEALWLLSGLEVCISICDFNECRAEVSICKPYGTKKERYCMFSRNILPPYPYCNLVTTRNSSSPEAGIAKSMYFPFPNPE